MLLLLRAHRLRLTSGVEAWTSLSSVVISVICDGFTVSVIFRDLPMCPSFLANPSSHWSSDVRVICHLQNVSSPASRRKQRVKMASSPGCAWKVPCVFLCCKTSTSRLHDTEQPSII